MSQENVEVVKRATAAYLAHDNEAARALYDPDIEIQGGFDGSVVYRGLSGVREYYSDWLGAIDLSGLEVEEWIDAGDDVIATFRHWGQGKLSGVPVEQRRSDVWTVRDGKLWRMRSFASRDEALKAVGLEESAMSEESTTPHPAERVRQFVEAANRGELDAAPSYLARDSVWDTSRVGIGVFEGAATIRRFMEDWFRGYEELQFVIDELLDVGSGVVLTVTRQMARPVGTTGYVQQREGWVWVWVDGLCASVTVYPEAVIDEARAAAERLAEERG